MSDDYEDHVIRAVELAEQDLEQDQRLRNLAATGIDVLGQPAGVLAGLLAAGPIGAVMAAGLVGAFGAVLKRGTLDMLDRQITSRQQEKLGVVYVLAVQEIAERQRRGEEPRDDGFFTATEREDSSAAQLLEAVCLRAMNNAQQKKLYYIAKIYGNAGYMRVSPDDAFLVLQYANDLTYRSLLCLSMVMRKNEFGLSERPVYTGPTGGHQDPDDEKESILFELMELARRLLIATDSPRADHFTVIESPEDIIPNRLGCGTLSQSMYHLMALDEIPHDEIENTVARHLR